MTDLEILDIIPLDKYPANAPDFFSYFAPAELKTSLYSIVKIPLKNGVKTGLVLNKRTVSESKLFLKNAKFNIKPIKGVLIQNPIISENQIKFAYWLKNHANISLSHAFYLLLQWLLKINQNLKIQNNISKLSKSKLLKKKNNNKQFFYLKELDKKLLKNLPALIIVPQEEYLKFLQKQYTDAIIADLSLPNKKFNEMLRAIYNEDKVLFIGTKNSIFLPWQKLSKIIIYEEGSAYYKESFRLPYFDYLNLIEKFSEIANIQLIKISSFPSLKTYINKQASSPKFTFETICNNLEAVENLLGQYKKIIIFSSQKIIAQRLVCENCKNTIECPNCNIPLVASEKKAESDKSLSALKNNDENDKSLSELFFNIYCKSCFYSETTIECKNCKNKEFQIKGTGAEWTIKYLKKRGYNVIFIKEHKDIKKIYGKDEFIIIGSQNLLTPNIPEADVFLFLNFDWGFQSADIFLKEKYLRVLETLSKKAKKIILQTNLPNDILQKISSGEILTDILKERENQFLPPYARMLKLVSRLQNLQLLNKRMLEARKEIDKRKSNFKERIEIWGPFLKKIPRKMSRHQLELILRVDHKINLRQLLDGIKVDEVEVDSYNMD